MPGEPLSARGLSVKTEIQHEQMLELFDQIKKGQRNYLSVKAQLRELQDKVLEHISLQNTILAEVLQNPVHAGVIDAKLLEFLQIDLRDIKIETLVFFDEHPADMGDVRPGNFSGDFAHYAQRMTERIKTEKEYVLPALKKFST